MMNTRNLLGISIICMSLIGCAGQEVRPDLTPVEIQSIQTRTYDEPKEVVFRSAMSVFQDIGYTIASADLSTGLITGEGAAQDNFARWFWTGTSQVTQTRATAFIEEVGDSTSVRLSFVEVDERSSMYGQRNRRDTPILDAEIYQNAFERIENAVFIRTSGSR